MKNLLMTLLFIPTIASAIDFSSDERRPFSGTHIDNSSIACQNARTLADNWLNSKNSSALVSIEKSVDDCHCDKPVPRKEQKLCYIGSPDCRSDGTKIVDIQQPVVCMVNAHMIIRNK